MKKLMIVIQMLAFILIIAIPAMAATKVTKELCMSLNTGGGREAGMELAIKKGGKIKYSNIKSTFYDIQGTISYDGIFSFPCDGSGYVNETSFPNPVFLATFQCSFEGGPVFGTLVWNLFDAGGRGLTVTHLGGNGTAFSAVEVDCKSATQN